MSWELHAHGAKAIPSSTKRTASLTVPLDQTTTEGPALLVLPPKNGTELNVLTDVIAEKFGTPLRKLVSVLLVNSGMNTRASYVPMAELGTLIANLANAQLHPLGTVLPVLYVLAVESTAMSPINANAQAAKTSTDSSAPSTAQSVNSTTKLSKDALAHQANSGTETFVSSVSVDKLGTLL